MKIRHAFVANSSSSSFIIVYDPMTATDAEQMYKTGNIPTENVDSGEVFVLGKWLSEGRDYFKLTPELIEVIAKYNLGSCFEPVIVLDQIDEDADFEIKSSHIGHKIMTVEADHHHTSLDTLEQRYRGYGR